MNWLIYHIGSGHVFFTGIALILASVLASRSERWIFKRAAFLFFTIGIIGVVISSTPIPLWTVMVLVLGNVAWLISFANYSWKVTGSFLCIFSWLLAAGLEFPFHTMPSLEPASTRTLMVTGDSVTAGMGGSDLSVKWPELLANEHQIEVDDRSHVGEKASSALKRISKEAITASIVLLEIGGNDLMGSTSSTQFRSDLDALLKHVAAANRQVIMFELPLPPFRQSFGRIQRELAATYDVKLIPKRVFLSVVANETSTVDSIHLTQSGHEQMAKSVWNILREAY